MRDDRVDGITRAGRGAETRYMSLTGAHPTKDRARGDCVLSGKLVEVKKVGAEGMLNQVRPVKYLPLVVWEAPRDRWYVIPPHTVVLYACARLRGQHTENPFECIVIALDAIRAYRTDAQRLAEATLHAWASGEAHKSVKQAMRNVLRDVTALASDHRQSVRAALDSDRVVDLIGASALLPLSEERAETFVADRLF